MVRFIEEDDEAMKTYGAGVRVCVCVLVLEDTWRDERLKRREVCASGLP